MLSVLLPWLGMNFSSEGTVLEPEHFEGVSHHFDSLRGSFHHAFLEWTAFVLAIVTCILAFSNYQIRRDPITPIIGVDRSQDSWRLVPFSYVGALKSACHG